MESVRYAGKPLNESSVAMIMIHGRGASAENILGLSREFATQDIAFVAPQATNHSWYPYSFLAPIKDNEPGISSALDVIGELLHDISEQGIPPHKIILLGFSQGACLSLEYAARHPQRYGGILALSGGVIGPLGMERHDAGDMQQTPVFLGCSDVDAHIPLERVQESTRIFQSLNAEVTERIYPGMGHTINQDEVEYIDELLLRVTAS
ncbi:MAG: alpha/beta fold hydrolase [Cyclobacteriaceae bacterium]